jgi:hypothetical protein
LGAVWALTLPDDQWLALRVHPLMSLERFVADIWPFYLGLFAFAVLVLVGRPFVTFMRFGILTPRCRRLLDPGALGIYSVHAQHGQNSLSPYLGSPSARLAVARFRAQGSRSDLALGATCERASFAWIG